MTNKRQEILVEKIREKLGRLQTLVSDAQLPDDAFTIHRRARHTDHQRCVTIGLNSTCDKMATDGSHGSYFTIDENGQLYEQHFVQGSEEHDYLACSKIEADDFFQRIRGLPRENMADCRHVLDSIEYLFRGNKP